MKLIILFSIFSVSLTWAQSMLEMRKYCDVEARSNGGYWLEYKVYYQDGGGSGSGRYYASREEVNDVISQYRADGGSCDYVGTPPANAVPIGDPNPHITAEKAKDKEKNLNPENIVVAYEIQGQQTVDKDPESESFDDKKMKDNGSMGLAVTYSTFRRDDMTLSTAFIKGNLQLMNPMDSGKENGGKGQMFGLSSKGNVTHAIATPNTYVRAFIGGVGEYDGQLYSNAGVNNHLKLGIGAEAGLMFELGERFKLKTSGLTKVSYDFIIGREDYATLMGGGSVKLNIHDNLLVSAEYLKANGKADQADTSKSIDVYLNFGEKDEGGLTVGGYFMQNTHMDGGREITEYIGGGSIGFGGRVNPSQATGY